MLWQAWRTGYYNESTTLQISSLPGTVLTDKKWFSFVLAQILTNAAKYTPRGTVRVLSLIHI